MRQKKRSAKAREVGAILDRLAGKPRPVIIRSEDHRERVERKTYRAEALARQDGRCRYCRDIMTPETVTAEHRRPRSKGGTTSRENIAASCARCNREKSSQTDGDFMREVRRPSPSARIEVLCAHIRRRLNLATERACRRKRRSVGLE